MKNIIISSIRMLLLMIVLTGIVYPLLITGTARVFFRDEARGSLVEKDGKVIGSSLIGQPFDSAKYFKPRPSAVDYQAFPSGASNLSWTDPKLAEMVKERKEKFARENVLDGKTGIPAEMLYSSGSGLDPHISPEAAKLQVGRIDSARNFSVAQKDELMRLIEKMTEKPQYSVFGKERINVLLLNIELDKIR